MMQVWFLVIVINSYPGFGSYPISTVTVPQANQAQCEINKASILKRRSTKEAYCMVGAMPKT